MTVDTRKANQTMTIQAVVLDIGNVLLKWNPEPFYEALIGPARKQAFFAEVDLYAMNLRVDRGEDFHDVIYATADQHPEWGDEIRHWHDSWLEFVQGDIPLSVRLMEQLQVRGVPVFSLTNFGLGPYDVARPHYPFLSKFDRDFISGALKAIKPEPDIYAQLEQATGLDGKDLLFTDDSAANIATARARGWNAHHFTGPEGWQERLQAEGLL